MSEEDRGDIVNDEEEKEVDTLPEETDEEEDVDGGDEEEVEDSDDEEESDEEEDDEKDKRIPLSRLNQVLAQRDQEKERAAWLEEQLEKLIEQGKLPEKKEEVEDPFDFSAAETKYVELVLDGEAEKAAELRAIIEEERELQFSQKFEGLTKKATEQAEQISKATIEEEKFNLAVANFEQKYPFLNSESDEYNPEATETANSLMIGYIQSGMTKTQAIKKAVKTIAPMYERAPSGNTNRKKTSRKKAVDTARKTPPKGSGKSSSVDLDEVDVTRMGEKDFAKLTAKEKAILRGDVM